MRSAGDGEAFHASSEVLRTMLTQRNSCVKPLWQTNEPTVFTRAFTVARTRCVALVRNITSHFHLGADTRDLATEFASVYLWKNDESTCECVELIAATAVIVAAKLLQQSSDVGIKSFAQFNLTRMRAFECSFILTIGPDAMSPLDTPSTFAHTLLRLAYWRTGRAVPHDAVSSVIGEFLQDKASLSFAPCTIAMAAVLLLVDLDPTDRVALLLAYADLLPPKWGICGALDADKCLNLLREARRSTAAGAVSTPPSVAKKRPLSLSPDNSIREDIEQSSLTTPQQPLKRLAVKSE